MADTNLTNLIINSLTRDEFHNADKSTHSNEVFLQKDHVGVYVGDVGIDGLDTTDVTSCITRIPQDIKLELNNGTLTLKAGSKVYIPNGVGVFDEVVRGSDLVYSFGTPSDGQYLVFNSQYFYLLSNCVSGATDSKAGQTYHSWYDTTNNLVKQYWADGSTPAKTDSLPVAIITISGGTITSIDQVFNGFGYIGSTIFALPGVKGLIPNGRNDDGSLKNTEITLSTVKIMNMASWMDGRTNAPLTLDPVAGVTGMDVDNKYWGSVTYLKDLASVCKYYALWYCAEDNKMHYFNGSAVESISQRVFVGSFDVDSNYKITSLNPKIVFHAVDYNDTEYIAHQAMPSNKSVSLTVGASGAHYIAPADGYFTAGISNGGYVELTTGPVSSSTNWTGGWARVFVPVKKGENMDLYYGEVTTWRFFKFVYANGAE